MGGVVLVSTTAVLTLSIGEIVASTVVSAIATLVAAAVILLGWAAASGH